MLFHSVNLCREISVTSCLTPWSTVLASKIILSKKLDVITVILWISKVCYHVHNCQTPVPTLSHISPVHSTALCLRNVHFKIILPPTHKPLTWPISLRFSTQILHTSPIFRISNTALTHPSFINFILLKVNGDKCKPWSSSIANYYQPSDNYFWLPNILLCILFSWICRHSSISVTDTLTHRNQKCIYNNKKIRVQVILYVITERQVGTVVHNIMRQKKDI